MKLSYHSGSRILGVALLAGIWSVACSGSNNNNTTTTTGGTSSTSPTATGGKAGTGGAPATGGVTAAAGAHTGGTSSAATSATGGMAASTGGMATTTGGMATTTGGMATTTGGMATATGGVTSTSTTAGGAATGGVTSTSSATGGMTNGGTTGTAGSTSNGGTTAAAGSTSCPIIWDWESTTVDSWAADNTDTTLAVSTTEEFTGTQSLAATLPALTSTANPDGGAGGSSMTRSIQITPATASNLLPGATVTAHIWVPADSGGSTTKTWVQIFMQSNNWANWDNSTEVTPTANAWTTLTFTVPAASRILPGGINRLGIQIGVSNGNSFAGGNIYIDSITVCGGSASCTGTTTGSFDFETAATVGSTGDWALNGTATDTVVSQSTAQHYSGTGSMLVAMTAVPAAASSSSWTSRQIQLTNPQAYCGQTVTYHVYADTIANLNVQPFAQIDNYQWSSGTATTITTADTWQTITFPVPTYNFLGIQVLGVQLSNTSTTATYTGNVYIDDITWQ